MRLQCAYGCLLMIVAAVLLESAGSPCAALAAGTDKSGVKPQVLSLPSGPGSIEGLGGSFEPQLNTGTATYSVKLALPPGVAGHGPALALSYNAGRGNSPFGIGWTLDAPNIMRQTDKGVPNYTNSDVFLYSDGEELVPLADGTWRAENEGAFLRCRRVSNAWEVTSKDGTVHQFGEGSGSRIERAPGEVFKWFLTSSTDTNGNTIDYSYIQFPPSKQIYLHEINYSISGGNFHSVAFDYETRPDQFGDFSSGIDIRTTKRCTSIRILTRGELVRRYALHYDDTSLAPPSASELMLSFSYLRRVTQFGRDNSTALPALRFAYTCFCTTGLAFRPVSPHPGVSLSQADTELLDVDGDSLPDVITTQPGLHSFYRNLGQGSFADDPAEFASSPFLSIQSSAAQFMDADGDGRSDLLYLSGMGPDDLLYYPNLGTPTWQPAITFANNPASMFDAPFRLVDLNGDKRIDVMRTTSNGYFYYLNGKNGQWTTVGPELPVRSDVNFNNPYVRLADMNGDRMQDLVLVTLDLGIATVSYWPMLGKHAWGSRVDLDPPLLLPGLSNPEDLILGDVNADGISDVIFIQSGVVRVWINMGNNSWSNAVQIPAPAFDFGRPTIRMADINGNGTPDLVYDQPGSPDPFQYLEFVPEVKPGLIRLIDNGLGKTEKIEYRTSTDYFVEAQNTSRPWQAPLQSSVHVVSRLTSQVRAMSGPPAEYVTQYTFWDGYYDSLEHEFRGFGYVEVKELGDATCPTKVTRHSYAVGRTSESLKGRLLSQEVVDEAGNLFTRATNSWEVRNLALGTNGQSVRFAVNERTDLVIDERTGSPVHLRTDFDFDDYGNTIQELNYGIVNPAAAPNDPVGLGVGNDEVLTYNTFATVTTTWILDKPRTTQIRNLSGDLQAESRFYYDALPLGQLSRGNLTRQESWLNTENRFIPSVRNVYDAFGNIIEITDANDHRRTITYDSVFHTYPVAEVVHLDGRTIEMQADYDFGLGTVISATDFAGTQSDFSYDTLGRQIEVRRPGGAKTTYAYQLADPVSHIGTKVLEAPGGGTFDSFSYFDGAGRKLGTKIEAEDAQWRYVDAAGFNQRAMEKRKWLPYFVATSQYEAPNSNMPSVAMEYDATARVVKSINSDQTFARTVFEPLVEHVWDENDNAGAATPTSRRSDGLKRLVEVTERNRLTNGPVEEYLTSYKWSTLGNLLQITDSQLNQKFMAYDSLQRNIFLNDPDRGVMTYEYDDVGNMIRSTDAKEQAIEYSYDFASRLIAENFLDQGGGPADLIDVTFHYDLPAPSVDFGDGTGGTAAFTGGRLTFVTDLSGEEHHSYDARGNILWTVKRIRDPFLGTLVSYKTGFDYDLMDRMTDLYFPDNDRARYSYNNGNYLERIEGGLGGPTVLSNLDYEPTGQLQRMNFGNGVLTTHAYDNRDRMATLRTVSPKAVDLIYYTYNYDPVSNITKITDNRPFALIPDSSARRNTQVLEYDDLYRLTQVKYSPTGNGPPAHGQIDYAYDRIGNMVSQTSPEFGMPGHIADPEVNIGAMTSGGAMGTQNRVGRGFGEPPGPHALTASESGDVFDYDANGNMTDLEGAALTWDFKDRLIRYLKDDVEAHYVYDYSGRRITKLVTQDSHTDQTLYIGPNFEYRPNRAPVKYVFSGDTRVARVVESLDPLRPRVQRIWLWVGWNLLTVAVETQQTAGELFGQDAQVFMWNDTDYAVVSLAMPIAAGTALWVNVPTSRVAVATGIYDPPTNPIAVPAGQRLVAWPRLEPMNLDQHFSSDVSRVIAYEPIDTRWTLADSVLPIFLADELNSISSAGAFWVTSPNQNLLLLGAAADHSISFYHGDHLGSANVITGKAGVILQESTYYPFGLQRFFFLKQAT